jgi:hypothetical protein
LFGYYQQTAGSGVPLGINVESLSIFREEIDAAHTLFQKLQVRLAVIKALLPSAICVA